MKKTEKTFFVDNLKEELKDATSVVLVDYSGLSVKMQQELKKSLKPINSSLKIVKNTLFSLAAKDAQLTSEAYTDTVLSGPTAIVITEDDPIAPLQVLHKFSSDKGIPQFKVGVVDGVFHTKESLTTLAKLPGKDVLFSQTVGAISAPLYGIVGTLQGNLQKLVYILNQAANK